MTCATKTTKKTASINISNEIKIAIKNAFPDDLSLAKEIIKSISHTNGEVTDSLTEDIASFIENDENVLRYVAELEAKKATEITKQVLKST